MSCSLAVEDVFGPVVASSCLHGFDFTLLFEETILTILPLCIAVFWVCLRVSVLWNCPRKVRGSWLLASKTTAYCLYIVLQIVILALWVHQDIGRTRATIATLSLSFPAFILFLYVSHLEHARSLRPSTFLTLYLGISLLLDLARARTLFYVPVTLTIAALNLTGFLIKLVIFLLELTQKRGLVLPHCRDAAPEATASIYNRALFFWLNGLLVKGFHSFLAVDTLTPLDRELLSASEPDELTAKWENATKPGKDALFWMFVIHYKRSLLAGVIPRLSYLGFLFAQPLLVQRVLDFTTEPKTINSQNIAYGLIGAYAIVYIGMAVSYSLYQHRTYRVLTEFRGSLVTLIYNKSLRVRTSHASSAEAITLMSADIDRIGFGMHLIHESYASAIELGIGLWLLYRFLGVAMAASTIWVVVILILGLPVSIAAGNAQVPWLEAIEKRLAATSRTLGGIKSLRMAGLATFVSSKLRGLREAEIRASRRFRFLTAAVTATAYLPVSCAPVWAFGAYILIVKARSSGTLTSGIAFAALTVFDLLDSPSTFLLSAVEEAKIILNSFRRIQEYLLLEEQNDTRVISDYRTLSTEKSSGDSDEIVEELAEKSSGTFLSRRISDPKIAVSVRNASAQYTEDGPTILKELNFDIPRGKTTMIVGPVGTGKSSLLRLMLGEIPLPAGTIATSFSKAAYCPQTAWIIRGSIKENILGVSAFDPVWYARVVQACALSADFDNLPEGDQTVTGSRGLRLSGGQKARVSLARALYSRNTVVILDDALSGLDYKTEKAVLDAVFGVNGLLKEYAITAVLATSSVRQVKHADYIIGLDESGSIARKGTLEELSTYTQYLNKRISSSSETNRDGASEPDSPDDASDSVPLPDDEIQLDSSRRTGDLKVYAFYVRAAGVVSMLVYICFLICFVFSTTFPSIWLQWWADANEAHPNERIGYWLGIYAVLAVIGVLFCFLSELLFMMVIVPRTSRKFHEFLLSTTMRAKTSFLTSIDTGQITNRFSQDLELIDNDLPQSFDLFVLDLLSTIGFSALVFTGSSYISAAIPLCLVILYLIQTYYLRTSRQLRLLDIEAKAPLFSNFLETLGGLACVRAYGWTNEYQKRHLEALNGSQKPYYLLWCIQRWLALVLNLFVAGLAILLVGLATNISSGATGFLGVALFNIVSFGSNLQNLVTEWTELETAIGAINRVRSYVSDTVAEDGNDKNDGSDGSGAETLPADWPQSGTVVFENVSAAYDESAPAVLKDVSFEVKAGEKVAVCGRTGSGKSSLILALLRMMDLQEGSITVGEVSIATVPREEVRKHLNTLPQDATTMQGSLRENIDPHHLVDDERVTDVLRLVRLGSLVDHEEGLDREMTDEMVSHGQRQLLCLARALVHPAKIVLMDEATSSVDDETEELMQDIIRTEFRDRTIIAVAHKLDTILEFDKVILLDAGRIIESGNPRALLHESASSSSSPSAFSALYYHNTTTSKVVDEEEDFSTHTSSTAIATAAADDDNDNDGDDNNTTDIDINAQ